MQEERASRQISSQGKTTGQSFGESESECGCATLVRLLVESRPTASFREGSESLPTPSAGNGCVCLLKEGGRRTKKRRREELRRPQTR
jgi:hypothetical protein